MGIPVRATRLGDLDLDPLEVRLGQSLTHIQNLDTDDAAALPEAVPTLVRFGGGAH